MRLIDADALEENVIDLLEIEWGYEGIREDVSRIIDNVPTVERPHGEWKLRSPYEEWFEEYKCSNCNAYGWFNWHFCPNCGADMKKEGEAE